MLLKLALMAGLGLGSVGAVQAQQLVLAPSAIVPAARFQLNLDKDGNGNTTVDLTAQHLAPPANLSPQATVYMVWVETGDQTAERKGILVPNRGLNAELKFVTPEPRFEIVITAERTAEPASPSDTVVARGSVARSQ